MKQNIIDLSTFRPQVLVAVAFLFCLALSCYSQISQNAAPRITVFTYGRSFYTDGKMNLFLDVYPSGEIEYDQKTKNGLKRAKERLDLKEIRMVGEIVSSPDFQKVKATYDPIFTLRDEVFVIKLVILNEGISKTIIIKNYMPAHPDAPSKYPGILIRLIDELEKLRPKSATDDDEFVSIP